MILDTIASSAKKRVERAKEALPPDRMQERARLVRERELSGGRPIPTFKQALKATGLSFICEVKKASPSKGLIAPDFPYGQIAREYEEAGAAAISVLTEPEFFLGSDRYLEEIAQKAAIPLLRKDFVVDEYQIAEAKTLGASAVLLICALLDTDTLRRYLAVCGELGLDALVEAHTEEEIRSALSAGAGIIGVNNRNLKDFTVDFRQAARLRSLVPDNLVFVAESGVKTPEDVTRLSRIGADAVLIGETLMRAPDRKAMLRRLKDAAGDGKSTGRGEAG